MLHLLWDASEIWGPLAEWGLRSLGLPFRVIRAADVASGCLQAEKPAMLLVPGGFGRRKAAALGRPGLDAARRYVREGGQYLGFCGGAGLALSGDGGLALCPRGRGGYANRMQHFMSGHFFVTAFSHDLTPPALPESPLLPVWWPGRFGAEGGTADSATVLAAYAAPGPDFFSAEDGAALLRGEPCLIHGAYGDGGYALSYSHLETPDSPDANAWLAYLLRRMGNLAPSGDRIPAWRVADLPQVWDEPELAAARDAVQAAMDAGTEQGSFFPREPWLTGWRPGVPGMALNTVRAELCTILSLPPSPAARALWRREGGTFAARFRGFAAHMAASPADGRIKDSAAGFLPFLDLLCCLQVQSRQGVCAKQTP